MAGRAEAQGENMLPLLPYTDKSNCLLDIHVYVYRLVPLPHQGRRGLANAETLVLSVDE